MSSADPSVDPDDGDVPRVDFDRDPSGYRHWQLALDPDDPTVAYVKLDVDEAGGLVPGYELKMNSYDLGVDIELYDITQRLRLTHPRVRAVVLTSAKSCWRANRRRRIASQPSRYLSR